MKNYIFTLTIILFFSCSTTNDSSLKQGEQKWQLIKMIGSFAGSETTGEAMQWQEIYVLKANNTFTKSRTESGNTSKVTGTYKYAELADGMYLELTYPSDNNLIGNCTGDTKEFLKVISGTLLQGTWLACDGPGLEYELK